MNLTSDDMDDLQRQVIAVDDDNYPSPENIPLPQLEESYSWISEGIICLRRSKTLHNTSADFKHYSREEVMKMTKLEISLLLSPVDYLKEILVPGTNKLLKRPNEPWRMYLVAGVLVLHGFLGRNFEQEELVVKSGAKNV